jgi:hemoglobin-like flavoprotein
VRDTAYCAISLDAQIEDDDDLTEAVNFSFSVSMSATELPHAEHSTTPVAPSTQHQNRTDPIDSGSNPSLSNSPSLNPITLADINANPSRLLSPETIEVLSSTWDVIVASPGGTSEFAKRFFSMMIVEARDNAKRMFAHLSRSTQEHMIQSVVRFAVTNNFHPEPLKHVGVVHAHLGVQREDFITFNRCFLETLRAMLGTSEWSDHRGDVWRDTMDLMASLMIPMSEEAEGLIAKVSHRSNGAGVVLGLHEKLVSSEKGLAF